MISRIAWTVLWLAAAALPAAAQGGPEVFGNQIIVSPRGVESAPFRGAVSRPAQAGASRAEATPATAATPVELDADLLRRVSQAAGLYVAPIEAKVCAPGISCKPTPPVVEQINLRVVGPAGDVSSLVEVTSADATSVERAVAAFNAQATLQAAPNYWRRTTQQAEPQYYLQWGWFGRSAAAGGANFANAWARSRGSPAVTVAVIDTGVVRAHPDIGPALVGGIDLVGVPLLAGDGDGYDLDASDPGDFVSPDIQSYLRNFGIDCSAVNSSWHGTHVAGTIAARVNGNFGSGGAPQVRVLPVRVLGKCGGNDNDIQAGLAWAMGLPVQGLPVNLNPAQVINMSLGGEVPCTPLYRRLFAEARRRNVVVVVSAGNSARNTAGFAPAGCPDVISVAAHDRSGLLASFSNFGANVTVSAPGVAILSSVDLGVGFPIGPSTAEMSGTSMAAPHVSAAVALLKSAVPGLTFDQVRQAVRQSAAPFLSGSRCSAGEPLYGLCGAGYLDADRLLALAGAGAAPAPAPTPAPAPSPVQEDPDDGRAGCFVATAAYGSAWHDEVRSLRRFRDDVLMQHASGRSFVAWYYRVSPAVADVIRGSDTLRALTRGALRPIIVSVEYPIGMACTLLGLLGLLGVLVCAGPVRRRRT